MARGLSYHFGLNQIDRKHYGVLNELPFCANDAGSIALIADMRGFEATLLLDEYATSQNLLHVLNDAAYTLQPGDIFFLSFSGHGGQVQDVNGDETDGNDEAFVMYDRMVIDDEIYQVLLRFREGVRVLFISDSCFSGTLTKGVGSVLKKWLGRKAGQGPLNEVYQQHAGLYDPIFKSIAPKMRTELQCSVLLLSACQDHESALGCSKDGTKLSAFTNALLRCWANGAFCGSYKDLYNEICIHMRKDQLSQQPNYFFLGRSNTVFEHQIPFTI